MEFYQAIKENNVELVKELLDNGADVNQTNDYENTPFSGVRWLRFDNAKAQDEFEANYSGNILLDGKDRICYGVKSDWDLKLAMDKSPKVKFYKNSDYIENHH